MPRDRSAGSEQTKPYLGTVPRDAAENVTAMEWARYLGREFGPTGAINALAYYRDVDWISERARRMMIRHVRGLSLEELDRVSDDPVEIDSALGSLEESPFERHAKSLEYIAKMAGTDVETDLVSLRHPDEHTVQ
ncbi:FlaD/FlaE family flagellar protein [Haloprofundus halophilus]|uniref:FlaD/FlaE family flagellar protein n=1 Tax=Haloprofundus halophilus TaxID=2283527 RepID=UPI000E43157D|nr:FlaD/FlaE family flagellar protein [Haloprofundus halophilus]